MAVWNVIQKQFSAVTIGINFQTDTIGWTSHTDGSSLPQIVKTHDGGATWNQVQNVTGVSAMPLSVAAHKTGSTNVGVTGPLESSLWSLDGERFVESIGAPFASQDIKNEGGHFMIAGGNGPCIGTLAGARYKCKKIPLKNKGSGRYASRPNGGDIIYFAAGQWPSDSTERVVKVGEEQHVKISRNIRIVDGKKMIHVEDTNDDPVNDYTAELWKSTDAGETWTNLMSDEGNFYFNDIHCADETHCVAVAEGFGESGGETGAHIYMTSDGETFNRVHTQNETGKESLMTARMISQTEYLAGGSTQQGGMFAPALILRSKDGGATHVNEGASVMGNSLTSIDCLSADHCYATALSALQICNILELGGNAPPAPAPTPTPTPGATHYEKPPCQDDEAQASVTDTDGAVCAPVCDASGNCPTDVPDGVTAQPTCALNDPSGNKYCALLCQSDDECGGAECAHPQAGAPGICVYPSTSNSDKHFTFLSDVVTV